jgi:hypothetical protein
MTGFTERLASLFAVLVRPLTMADGESEISISEGESRLGLRLPAVLRDYYRLAGRFDRFNRAHNRLLRPEEWSVDGGKLVFLDENQRVVVWGVKASRSPADDPPVYQGTIIRQQPTEWYREHKRCSEFLLVMLHLQAVWGGYKFLGGSDIASEPLEKFLTRWTPVGRVNEMLALCREGAAACVFKGKGEGSSQLYVGGRTERDFDVIVTELEALGVAMNHL